MKIPWVTIGIVAGVVAISVGCVHGLRWVAAENARIEAEEVARKANEPCPTTRYQYVVIAPCTDGQALNERIGFMERCGYKVTAEPKTATNWQGCETTVAMERAK